MKTKTECVLSAGFSKSGEIIIAVQFGKETHLVKFTGVKKKDRHKVLASQLGRVGKHIIQGIMLKEISKK